MAMPPERQYMTFEQYMLLVNDSQRRYEYYDGEVRLMAGGSSNHAAIALNFGVALDQALGDERKRSLKIIEAPTDTFTHPQAGSNMW